MNSNLKLLPTALFVAVLALAGCGGGGSDAPTEMTPEEKAAEMERMQATTAINAANMAAIALTAASEDAAVTAAETLIQSAKDEIDDLPAADQAAELAKLSAAESIVSAQRARLTAEAEAAAAKSEEERIKAEQEAAEAAAKAAAMRVTAAKLYAGISAPTATDTETADTPTTIGTRFARLVPSGDGTVPLEAGKIDVAISDRANAYLSEDKTAVVAALHGWTGKRYHRAATTADPATYEAHVYSNKMTPTPGKMFGSYAVVTATGGFQYQLSNAAATLGELVFGTADPATGVIAVNTAHVASGSFDHGAGHKTFAKPANTQRVMISGSYHGVSGTYNCQPNAGYACAAQVAASGFVLGAANDANNDGSLETFGTGNVVWTFKPSNANARVLSPSDSAYALYGWWLRKEVADTGSWTASAFVDEKGNVPDAQGLNDLNGTATYEGGAAGKYALHSTTGGTNDAGHFTADAMLQANFTSNTTSTAISGTIDNFMGADGEARDWTVQLRGSTIGDTGVIGNSTNGTIWTIGDTAAAAAGNWTGSLRNNGADGVPRVATGTFYSEYGRSAGKMVGAFGANKQ